MLPPDAPLLDQSLLAALEARWRQQGWPGIEWLRPGLSDAEIESATAPLGLRLPLEARRWWGWHDGTIPPAETPNGSHAFGGLGFRYLPLAEAVAQYRQLREDAALVADPDVGSPDEYWNASWFPLTLASHGTVLACDCSDPGADRAPIRVVDWELETIGDVNARSLGELVSKWVDAIDRAAWQYDAEQGGWQRDRELLDVEEDLSRLV